MVTSNTFHRVKFFFLISCIFQKTSARGRGRGGSRGSRGRGGRGQSSRGGRGMKAPRDFER